MRETGLEERLTTLRDMRRHMRQKLHAQQKENGRLLERKRASVPGTLEHEGAKADLDRGLREAEFLISERLRVEGMIFKVACGEEENNG
ncbi:MAG TPA: hypothetical protein VGK71_05960 [Nitrospirota bacterium]|jgi:hypothetical protein